MIVSLSLLFEVIAVTRCLHALYGVEVKRNLKTLVFIFVEITLLQVVHIIDINNFNTMWMYVGVVIYCGVSFDWKIREIFVNNVICIFIISVLQASLIIFISLLARNLHMGQTEVLFINIATYLCMRFLAKKVDLAKASKILKKDDKIVMALLLVVVASVLFFITNYKYEKGINLIYYVILILGVILFGAVLIDIGKHKLKASEVEAELRLHKLYEKSFLNLIDDIRAKQHEFDNHINTIYSQHYLYDTYDELVEAQRKYCKNVEQENKYNKLLSKGNSIIIGLLYSKFTEAEKLGIEIEHKVQIGNMKCAVPIYKVVELLGNLITNAIEALEKYEDLNKLRVIIVEQAFEITIDISNECKSINYDKIQQFFKRGYSEKGKDRGIGLYNVKKICEEYDIVMETIIKQQENVEWLHFILIINKPL